jgi:hypothetical protein
MTHLVYSRVRQQRYVQRHPIAHVRLFSMCCCSSCRCSLNLSTDKLFLCANDAHFFLSCCLLFCNGMSIEVDEHMSQSISFVTRQRNFDGRMCFWLVFKIQSIIFDWLTTTNNKHRSNSCSTSFNQVVSSCLSVQFTNGHIVRRRRSIGEFIERTTCRVDKQRQYVCDVCSLTFMSILFWRVTRANRSRTYVAAEDNMFVSDCEQTMQ